MNLAQCLTQVESLGPVNGALQLSGICSDSRQIKPGDLFVSLSAADSCTHLRQAFRQGAAAALIDSKVSCDLAADDSAKLVPVDNLSAQASLIAGNFFDHPSRRMRLVGITGTNGKTSLCKWLEFLLCRCGMSAASLGTLGVSHCGDLLQPADGMTTRDAIESQRWLSECREAGAEVCAMEVSSHGLQQGRVAAVHFNMALFTNFTRDHLDFHGSEEAYWQAKRRLFDMPDLEVVLVNLDDARGCMLADELRDRVRVVGFSSRGHKDAQLSAINAVFSPSLQFQLQWQGQLIEFKAPWLVAEFELSNLCAALAVAMELGASVEDLYRAVAELKPARGRLQPVGRVGGSTLYVDYAHTPDAVQNSLQALRASAPGQLLAVLGCGGDRDPGKRPLMAAAALTSADRLLITSDNPRSESAQQIADDMMRGVPGDKLDCVDLCLDRARAIEQSVAMMSDGYSVALLGKGHETCQLVGSEKQHFSDIETAAACIGQAGGELL